MLYFMRLIHPLFTFQIKGSFFTDILRKNCSKTQLFPLHGKGSHVLTGEVSHL